MRSSTAGLLLLALLVGLCSSEYSPNGGSNSNRRRLTSNNFYNDRDQDQDQDQDQNQDSQQQPKPFQAGWQYTYSYNGQISSGLDTTTTTDNQEVPQQKAVTRIESQAQISFQQDQRASLRLKNIRVGQANREMENEQEIQFMQMFEKKNIQEHQRKQLEYPVQFEYQQGVVGQIQFHREDPTWSRNIKRSVLNLIQLNLDKQGQQQQLGEQDSEEQDSGYEQQQQKKGKTFTLPEVTIEGECQTTYTINQNREQSQQQREDERDTDRTGSEEDQKFNVTKTIDFNQCQKIADVGFGFQTQEQQPECVRCPQPWEKKQSRGRQQQENSQPLICQRCDPKEIKHNTLGRTTMVRYVLQGQSTQRYAIERAELISQYVYKNLQTNTATQSSSAMQTMVVAELVFRQCQRVNQQQDQEQGQMSQDSQSGQTLLFDNQWDVQEKRFYQLGDQSGHSPFEQVSNKVEQAQQLIRRLTQAASDKQKGMEFDQLVQVQRLVELFRMCSVEELQQMASSQQSSSDNEQDYQQSFGSHHHHSSRNHQQQQYQQQSEQMSPSRNHHQQQSQPKVRSESEQKKQEQLVADCLAMAGTRNTIQVLSQKITRGELQPQQAFQALKALRSLPAPSDEQAEIVLQLCRNEAVHRSAPLKQTCWLTLGSVVAEVCRQQQQQQQEQEQTQQVFGTQTGFKPKQQVCGSEKKETYKQALVEQYEQAQTTYEKVLALKAIGNAGLSNTISYLQKIINGQNGKKQRIERVQAIDALRRLRQQMPKKIQAVLLPIFQDTKEDAEVRMAAFNMIIHTLPQQDTIDQITYTLIQETQPEVQSFVFSTLNTLTTSKVPAEQQIAKHLKDTLKMAKVDELRSSRKYQLPVYSEEQKEGVFLNLMSVYRKSEGELPSHVSMSVDSLLNDQYQLNAFKVSVTQQNMEQWYEKVVQNVIQNAGNQRNSNKNSRARRSSYNPQQDMRDIFNGLNIQRRRQNNQEQQDNEPFGMISVRVGDRDQAILAIDRENMPECLKQVLNGERPRLSELVEKMQDTQHFRLLTTMNINERSGRIPTSMGLPLRILQAMPIMVSIEGNANIKHETSRSNSPLGIKAELNVHPSACIAHIQKMESWMPIIATGVESTRALEVNVPIQSEIQADSQHGIKFTVKTPQAPKTRVFGMHSLPSTYTREWDSKTKMLREPKVKSIHHPQLEQLQKEVDKKVGQHTLGMPFHLRGHYHSPIKSTSYRHLIQLLMATENHIHLTYEPQQQDGSPKEVIFRVSGQTFQKAAQGMAHGPELDNFYSKASQFQKAHSDDDFQDMELENESQRKQKLNSFIGSYRPSQMYQHSIKMEAETRGGAKQCKAEMELKAACDPQFQFCKAYLDAERTPSLAQEKGQWTLKAKFQLLRPQPVSHIQQIASSSDKHQKMVCQCHCEWGAERKQNIQVRIQGERGINQQQRQQLDQDGPLAVYQKKRSAFLNKYDMVAEYKLQPIAQNYFHRVFELLKCQDPWNTQSELQTSGRDGQVYATLVIDPLTQQHANLSVKTPSQSVKMQGVELPIKFRPFPLVRARTQESHSIQQLVKRMAVDNAPRAQCKVDGKRVKTFDGVLYKAPIGNCYTVLAKDCASEEDQPKFVVAMKSEQGQDKKIKMLTPEQTIVCQTTGRGTNKKLECTINGQTVQSNGNQISSSAYNNNQDSSSYSENQGVVEFNNEEETDVTIRVDQGVEVRMACSCRDCRCQKVWIRLSQQYKQGQCGLCGHYDDQAEDELRMGNNQLTEDLGQFHRSYSLSGQQGECTNQDQDSFYSDTNNQKKFQYSSRTKKSNYRSDEQDEDEDNNQEELQHDNQWQAGTYRTDDDTSSQEEDQWQQNNKRWQNKNKGLKRQRGGKSVFNNNNNQQGSQYNQENENEEEPIEQTKVLEFNHKICFSVQPVKQCPEGTSPAGNDDQEQDNDNYGSQQQGGKKIQFACLNRSSAEARQLQRQARKGLIVDVSDKSPSFVEAVRQPTRCVAY